LNVKKTKVQLSFMMFLEFFIWGGWYVTTWYLWENLQATGAEAAKWRIQRNPGGQLIAPFIVD